MAAGGDGGRSGFGHRPHLDGLRAVAVYLVVLFHCGLGWASGGFVGVDVFFVLSGYLVTNLLIGDLWGAPGRTSLRSFYARRARRLLPAALVVLVATALVYRLAASPAALDADLTSFKAAALYVANWQFIRSSTDYFAADLESNPVLHYWSLSIEEQFYLLWPVVLLGLTWLRRRLPEGEDVVRGIVVILIVASAGWAIVLADSDVTRAYYGSDARAYQLLAGALLAMTPRVSGAHRAVVRRRSSGWLAAACLGGIVLLGTSLLDVGPVSRGLAVTVLTVALLALLERTPSVHVARRSLSTPAITYLGRISYGTYLWHWPVIVVLALVLPTTAGWTAMIAIPLATGLAAASSQLLELPVRRSPRLDLRPMPVVAVGLVASILVALVVLPRIADLEATPVGETAERVGAGPSAGEDAATIDWAAASEDQAEAKACIDQPVSACAVGAQDGPKVLLIGDSHGVMVRPALEAIAEERGWALNLAVVNGCSWQWGLVDASDPERKQQGCFDAQSDIYERIVPEIDPDLVVVIGRAPDDPDRPVPLAGATEALDALETKELLRRTANRSLDALREGGHPTVLLAPVPVAGDGFDPIECLSKAASVAECRFIAREGRTPLEGYLAKRGDPDFHVVGIDELACPYFPICDPVIDGTVVRWDDTHLTATYAASIADDLDAKLEETGALPS